MKCEHCGSKVNGKPRRFCTYDCHRQSRRTHLQKAECKWCGVEFTFSPTKVRGSRGRYCCREHFFSAKRFRSQIRRAQHQFANRLRMLSRVCQHCGTPARGQFCSPECRHKATYQPVPVRSFSCRDCGAEFSARHGMTTYCSACKRARLKQANRIGKRVRKGRIKLAKREAINPLLVYERDGWRCGICGRKVSRTVDANHPLAPSLDHIVPLSKGGDHSQRPMRPSPMQRGEAHQRAVRRRG